MKVYSKINIRSIIKNHLATLVNANTNKAGCDDYITFLITPLAITGLLLFFKIKLSNDIINLIITTLSILVGLLFNVIVLVFDIIRQDKTTDNKRKVLKQLLSNIAFTILVSIIAILITLFTFLDNYFVKTLFTAILYFLLSNFIITVFMILKRMFLLFHHEMDSFDD